MVSDTQAESLFPVNPVVDLRMREKLGGCCGSGESRVEEFQLMEWVEAGD